MVDARPKRGGSPRILRLERRRAPHPAVERRIADIAVSVPNRTIREIPTEAVLDTDDGIIA
jgi:hypothetical protein